MSQDNQLVTTLPCFNSFERTVLVPAASRDWYVGQPLLTLDCLSGSLQVFGADAISNWFALRGSGSFGQSVASGLSSTVCSWNWCQTSTM